MGSDDSSGTDGRWHAALSAAVGHGVGGGQIMYLANSFNG